MTARPTSPRNDEQWALAQDIAKKITAGELWLPEVGYSTYYHANYVSPRWVGDMNRIDKIGRHIFYKKRNEEPYVVEASTAMRRAGASTGFDVDVLPHAPLFSGVGGSDRLSL